MGIFLSIDYNYIINSIGWSVFNNDINGSYDWGLVQLIENFQINVFNFGKTSLVLLNENGPAI